MKMEDVRVLVTGGSGFIGQHLIHAYLQAGVGCLVCYDLVRHPKGIGIVGDVRDEKKLERIVRRYRINIIEHLAAQLEVYKGIQATQEDADININGTLSVLEVARKCDVERVQFASSGAVYGRREGPHKESDVPEPHWPYGVSKLAGEQYVMQFHRLYGMKCNAFRYGIVYGQGEWYGRALTMFLKRVILEDKPLVIYGDGYQTRDFVYVGDIVKAHVSAVERNVYGTILNLGSGVGTAIKDLATIVCGLDGKRNWKPIYSEVREGEVPDIQPDRIRLPGEIRDFVLDSGVADSMLFWKSEVVLPDGITAEIAWLKRNPHAWDYLPRV